MIKELIKTKLHSICQKMADIIYDRMCKAETEKEIQYLLNIGNTIDIFSWVYLGIYLK